MTNDRDEAATRAKALAIAERAREGTKLPLEHLVAAAAIQLAAGYSEPRDYYVRAGAEALARELVAAQLVDVDPPPPAFTVEQQQAGAQLWGMVAARIRAALEEERALVTFGLWIEPITALGTTDDGLWLAAPPSARAWVARRYRDALEAMVAHVTLEHGRKPRPVYIAAAT